jgi:hypothetical protein
MADLITEDDFEDLIGRDLTATESTRFAAYAPIVSRLIRRYTGLQFEEVASAEYTGRPVGTKLRLPHRPVTGVTSVTAIGWAGTPDLVLPAAGGWGWDGLDQIEIYPLAGDVWVNLPETWGEADGPNTYRVVYDHGETPVPDEIVGIAAAMIARTLLSPSQIENLTSERIGQYSYQLGQFPGGGGPGVTPRLMEVDKDALYDAGYRPVKRSRTVQLAS